MTRRHFRNIPAVDPELVELLDEIKAETEVATGAKIPVTTASVSHLGHHYGPVHPEIVEYTLPK